MKTKIEVELEDFTVPNFAVIKGIKRESGIDESIPLSMLDSDSLSKLCSVFSASVFKNAGKEMPPKAGESPYTEFVCNECGFSWKMKETGLSCISMSCISCGIKTSVIPAQVNGHD